MPESQTAGKSKALTLNSDPLLALVGTLKRAFPEGAEQFLHDIRAHKELANPIDLLQLSLDA